MKKLLLLLTCLLSIEFSQATILTTGEIDPADPSSWDDLDYTYVGHSSDGTLSVSGGDDILSLTTYIGNNSGVNGSVTITDSGSSWTSSLFFIGYYGIGELNATNGGAITSSSGILGFLSGSNGTATISGTDSIWNNTNDLEIGAGGTGTLTISNGGTLNTGNYSFIASNAVSTGTVNVNGAGSIWDSGNYITVGYRGNGTLNISDGATVSNVNYAIIGDGTGSTGTVNVTGADSTWTNGLHINVGFNGNGTLNIENGGAVSCLSGYIAHQSNSTSEATVTGTGSTWTMSNELYIGRDGTGSLNISNGGIVYADSAIIGSNGILSGNSLLSLDSGSGTLTNNGTIAPGNSIGTLSVDGDVIFDNGSSLDVEIDNSGNCDKLDVTGDVTINSGTTLAVNSNGEIIEDGKSYTLIEADGDITGEFTTLDTSLVTWDTLIRGNLNYNTSTVVLTSSVSSFADTTIFNTDNQIACGLAIQQISDDGGTIGGITSSLQSIVGNDNLRTAYNQLSGQTRASIAPISDAGISQFTNIVSGRMMNTQIASLDNDDPMLAMADNTFDAYAMLNQNQSNTNNHYGFWTKGLAAIGNRDTEDGVNGYDYRLAGFTLGLDQQFTENLLGGVIFGYSKTDVEYSDSSDNSQIDSIYTGLYGSYMDDDGYLDGIFTYNNFANKTERYVNFLNQKLDGDFDGYEFSGYLEAARNHNINGLLVQPLIGFGAGYQNQEGYTEEGGSSALRYKTQTYESYKSSLGTRISKVFKQENGSILLGQFRAKWNHEFGDTESDITANFASTPGYNFTIKDSCMDRDSAILGVGLKYEPNKTTRFIVDYDTIINGDSTSHVFGASLKIMW